MTQMHKKFHDASLTGRTQLPKGSEMIVNGAQRNVPIQATASTLVLTALDAGKTIVLDRAAGVAVTLPAANGTGARFKFVVKTTVTSNSNTIKVANGSDVMQGVAIAAQDGGDTVVAFEAGATADTITGNGTTTGGLRGDVWELEDVAPNLWSVRGVMAGTGTEATPFSATVA